MSIYLSSINYFPLPKMNNLFHFVSWVVSIIFISVFIFLYTLKISVDCNQTFFQYTWLCNNDMETIINYKSSANSFRLVTTSSYNQSTCYHMAHGFYLSSSISSFLCVCQHPESSFYQSSLCLAILPISPV